MTLIRRIVLSFLALATFFTPTVLLDATPATAAVTNCTRSEGWKNAYGNCTGRTANPPYTTQWALQGSCYDGKSPYGPDYGTTTGWRTAGTGGAYTATCITDYYFRPGSSFFVFR